MGSGAGFRAGSAGGIATAAFFLLGVGDGDGFGAANVELPVTVSSPGEQLEPSGRFQSGGGTICTMLPHFGQPKMSPITDASLTTSRALQVVH